MDFSAEATMQISLFWHLQLLRYVNATPCAPQSNHVFGHNFPPIRPILLIFKIDFIFTISYILKRISSKSIEIFQGRTLGDLRLASDGKSMQSENDGFVSLISKILRDRLENLICGGSFRTPYYVRRALYK